MFIGYFTLNIGLPIELRLGFLKLLALTFDASKTMKPTTGVIGRRSVAQVLIDHIKSRYTGHGHSS